MDDLAAPDLWPEDNVDDFLGWLHKSRRGKRSHWAMRSVIVDTNIVSFAIKSDSRIELYKPHLMGSELVLAFMTLAELHRCAIKYHWKETRVKKFQNYIQDNYLVHYGVDATLLKKLAAVREEGRAKARPIENDDVWIAATALVLDLPLVTHNLRDFEHIEGVTVIGET